MKNHKFTFEGRCLGDAATAIGHGRTLDQKMAMFSPSNVYGGRQHILKDALGDDLAAKAGQLAEWDRKNVDPVVVGGMRMTSAPPFPGTDMEKMKGEILEKLKTKFVSLKEMMTGKAFGLETQVGFVLSGKKNKLEGMWSSAGWTSFFSGRCSGSPMDHVVKDLAWSWNRVPGARVFFPVGRRR